MVATTTIATTPSGITVDSEDIKSLSQWILDALKLKYQGQSTTYNQVVAYLAQVNRNKISPQSRRVRFYNALSIVCSSFQRHNTKLYDTLVHQLFCYDWKASNSNNSEVTASYASFICTLVSSNGTFVLPVVEMLVKNLVPDQEKKKKEDDDSNNSIIGVKNPENHPDKEEADVSVCILSLLTKVLRLCPSGIQVVFPVVRKNFPHRVRPTSVQVGYLTNLLKVSENMPGGQLEEQMMMLIIDQVVCIDVEIKLDDSSSSTSDLFTTLDTSSNTQDEGDDVMAEKLDQMMDVLFTYCQKVLNKSPASAFKLFKILSRGFDRSVLNTHRSKYPQFLLFYVCQSPEFQRLFTSQLLAGATAGHLPLTTRLNCASYLASFLARAKTLDVELLKTVLTSLTTYLLLQVNLASASSSNTCTVVTRLFQALFYVVCFRGLDLVKNCEDGLDFLRSIDWPTLVAKGAKYSLVDVAENVATEFLNIAEALGLIDDELLEYWDTILSESTSSTPKKGKKMFFPFDPYLLSRSYKYIGPLYLYWKDADPLSEEHQVLLSQIKTRNVKAEGGSVTESPDSSSSEEGSEMCTDDEVDDDEDDECLLISTTPGRRANSRSASFVEEDDGF